MSQNVPITIEDQGFPAFRTDLNNSLSALLSLSSGSSQPSQMVAYQLWYDSSTNILKIRNADNDAWINLFAANQTADTASPSTIDIVNDTTPQLGGNLDVNTKNITFGDSAGTTDDRLVFGAGTDLSIYHDSADSNIVNATGELNIKGDGITLLSNTGGEEYITCDVNGAVTLYHNDVIKAATTANGLSITGTAVATTNTDTSNSGTVTLDFATNQNFVLTITGAVTLANPTTEQVGQSGFIVFIQDSSGGATISLGTQYKTAGGVNTLTLSSAAGATDVVPYIVSAADSILLGTPQLNFS